jgi:uncharacterized protein (DUF697 family)
VQAVQAISGEVVGADSASGINKAITQIPDKTFSVDLMGDNGGQYQEWNTSS